MFKNRLTSVLPLILTLIVTASFVYGNSIVITPQEARVEPAGGVQFEAFAFDESGQPVRVDNFDWTVVPENLGVISNEGYFVAGTEPDFGKILAGAQIGNQRFSGSAEVMVGQPPDPAIKIVVEPEKAVVPPLGTRNFKAIAVGPNGMSLRISGVRWFVEPKTLGFINNKGVFTAGPRHGEGDIIALVEIENKIYRGAATIWVSEKPSGVIAGHVTDEENGPLSGATVSVKRLGVPAQYKKINTDENGEYVVNNLVPGNFVVMAETQGYVREFYDDVTTLMEASVVTVAENDSIPGIDFQLEKGGSISGLVSDELSASPLKGAHVVAYLIVNPNRKYQTYTDKDGIYKIEGLGSGSYAVLANQAGYTAEFYNGVKLPEDITPVNVTAPDETPGIDFSLQMTNALTGVVTNEQDGTPVAGAVVAVHALLTEKPGEVTHFEHMTRTNDQGEFAMQLRAGFYLVYTKAKEFVPEWYQEAEKPAEGTPVQVFTDQHTTIRINLAPYGGISGTVIDENSQLPIAGARVNAFYEGRIKGDGRFFSVLTGTDGTYSFDAIPPGDYMIAAKADSYLVEFWQEADSVGSATPVTVESGKLNDEIDFTLVAGGQIGGRVLNAKDNTPLEKAIVAVLQVHGHVKKSVKTNENGEYTVYGLPAGTYKASAVKKGYVREWYLEKEIKSEATPIELTASGVQTDIDFTLSPVEPGGGGLSGVVLDDSTGQPIEGAVVAIMPLTYAKPKRTVTGQDGTYELTGVKPGVYIAVCRAQGYIGEFYDNTHFWLKAKHIKVEADQITDNINFGLAPQEEGAYAVSGTVTDRTGAPVEGALVRAQEYGRMIAAGLTDEDGGYHLDNLPAGLYSLSASLTGFEDGYYNGESLETAETVPVGSGINKYDADIALNDEITGIGNTGILTEKFRLEQNYPNPFNPVTEIRFVVPKTANIKLTIFNLLGKEVKTIFAGQRQAGVYSISWDGTDNRGMNLATGIYIYRLEAETNGERFVENRRMILLK
ncbi:carboxypeptidase regulatory-like domain-containing protein [candidate division KSB1 bacterium]|nr:carboxypeptidase regulatory-like domain-containing protein [candidate division KSB1 bacterium]